MRLLLFSDLHRDANAARDIVAMSSEVDAVIGAGDFATKRKGISDVIDVLAKIDRPAVLVPGNGESFDELVTACRAWPSSEVLHGSGAEINGAKVWGVGGAIPVTPFGAWSYDFSEEEGSQLLEDCPRGAILVSHSPPKGAADTSSSGQHLGSEAVLNAVKRLQPALVVCGHIHDSWGRSETIGSTPVINAGPKGVMWEIPG